LPNGMRSRSPTRLANFGCALPEKIFNSATGIFQCSAGHAWVKFDRQTTNVYGWGGRTRTYECKDQNLVPYQLGDTPFSPQKSLYQETLQIDLCVPISV
jgi:hypothetical protein